MNQNENFVITVNRLFGSGGHQIAAQLADKLGVRFVDKVVLAESSKLLNVDVSEIERIEKKKPHWWEDIIKFYSSTADMMNGKTTEKDVTTRQLFRVQSLILEKMVNSESCVIVGRCSFDMFKDHPHALRLFIYSDMEHRIKRVMRMYNVDEAKAAEMIRDNDRVREAYTKIYTGKDRQNALNYHLCIDVDKLGIDRTVDFILDYMKRTV